MAVLHFLPSAVDDVGDQVRFEELAVLALWGLYLCDEVIGHEETVADFYGD